MEECRPSRSTYEHLLMSNSLIDLLKDAEDGSVYQITGRMLNIYKRLLTALWKGENIGNSSTISVNSHGPAGMTLTGGTAGPAATAPSWPWSLKNTTIGPTGQVQLNGGDGFVAMLSSFICNVNGNPSDTLVSGAYPQLSVTGNGFIYAFAVPTTPGDSTVLSSLDLFYEGTAQTQDISNPATYFWMAVATISNYATDGSGNVSFDVNNAYGSGYGPSTLAYCTGALYVY